MEHGGGSEPSQACPPHYLFNHVKVADLLQKFGAGFSLLQRFHQHNDAGNCLLPMVPLIAERFRGCNSCCYRGMSTICLLSRFCSVINGCMCSRNFSCVFSSPTSGPTVILGEHSPHAQASARVEAERKRILEFPVQAVVR